VWRGLNAELSIGSGADSPRYDLCLTGGFDAEDWLRPHGVRVAGSEAAA
jgi:hypothetical protein